MAAGHANIYDPRATLFTAKHCHINRFCDAVTERPRLCASEMMPSSEQVS